MSVPIEPAVAIPFGTIPVFVPENKKKSNQIKSIQINQRKEERKREKPKEKARINQEKKDIQDFTSHHLRFEYSHEEFVMLELQFESSWCVILDPFRFLHEKPTLSHQHKYSPTLLLDS
jgi:hypothetical protein